MLPENKLIVADRRPNKRNKREQKLQGYIDFFLLSKCKFYTRNRQTHKHTHSYPCKRDFVLDAMGRLPFLYIIYMYMCVCTYVPMSSHTSKIVFERPSSLLQQQISSSRKHKTVICGFNVRSTRLGGQVTIRYELATIELTCTRHFAISINVNVPRLTSERELMSCPALFALNWKSKVHTL